LLQMLAALPENRLPKLTPRPDAAVVDPSTPRRYLSSIGPGRRANVSGSGQQEEWFPMMDRTLEREASPRNAGRRMRDSCYALGGMAGDRPHGG
jgi:hypothetical protein